MQTSSHFSGCHSNCVICRYFPRIMYSSTEITHSAEHRVCIVTHKPFKATMIIRIIIHVRADC